MQCYTTDLVNRIRSFWHNTWQDLSALPFTLSSDRDVLAIIVLTLLPWGALIVWTRDLNVLQPLVPIFGFIGLYWLFGHRRPPGNDFQIRRPRLELAVALGLEALWILYRIVEYWHLFPLPDVGVNACSGITSVAVLKTVEMFIVPVAFLLLLRYSWRQMGFDRAPFAWLMILLPAGVLIVEGLRRHALIPFAESSVCFYFAAGLPEEFLFRAFLQTRLEAFFRNPLWAVWFASFLFGMAHIPIDLGGSFAHWQDALLTAFSYQMTVGFALGYAYLCSRNVLPLSILHALIDSSL